MLRLVQGQIRPNSVGNNVLCRALTTYGGMASSQDPSINTLSLAGRASAVLFRSLRPIRLFAVFSFSFRLPEAHHLRREDAAVSELPAWQLDLSQLKGRNALAG